MQHFPSAHWLLGFAVVGFLACRPVCGQALPVVPQGFTADTTLSLTMEHDRISRFLYSYEGKGQNEWGTVRIVTGHTTQSSNKIMLYGDRMEPRYPGEPDWQMTPYPVSIFIGSGQTSISHKFQFGDLYAPPGLVEWEQVYIYTAVVNRVGGGSTLASDTLHVYDCNVGGIFDGSLVDEEDSY